MRDKGPSFERLTSRRDMHSSLETMLGKRLVEPQHVFETTTSADGLPRLTWRTTYRCYPDTRPDRGGRQGATACWVEIEPIGGKVVSVVS